MLKYNCTHSFCVNTVHKIKLVFPTGVPWFCKLPVPQFPFINQQDWTTLVLMLYLEMVCMDKLCKITCAIKN
jgi:hypothetical protein